MQLPKEKLIYGPMQIEAMIDQDTAISMPLSLCDTITRNQKSPESGRALACSKYLVHRKLKATAQSESENDERLP